MNDKSIEPYFFEKLKVARKLIGRTQRQMSYDLGRSQRDISAIENGVRRKMISHDYMMYLYDYGIDLNWLYAQEPIEDITPEKAESKAFRIKTRLTFSMVPFGEVHKLSRIEKKKDLPKYFEEFHLPGLSPNTRDTYVGFISGNEDDPFQAGEMIICRATELDDLIPGRIYFIITEGKLKAVEMGDREATGSDKYIHWVEGKILRNDIIQVWEPVKSLSDFNAGSRGIAALDRLRR